MSNIAIEFDNISKQYALGSFGTGTLSRDLNRWWARVRGQEDPYLRIGEINDRSRKASSDFVWALKDIDFSVMKGEVLGIIGKNGAGKSTLLKILSRVTTPTTGCIRARGRIASLLEVGTGFHPEMTGRENIYMNGSIMGMTKAEITHKLDEIVAFAGVEKFIDTPVKRYSSGMTVRLGFAIAAHLEPEILVVDEVLAVGDAEFQRKAIGKMQEISHGDGRTVLFVSHNMAAVQGLCTQGIVLENGSVAYKGKTAKDAVDYYLSSHTNSAVDKIKKHITYCDSFIDISQIMINGVDDDYSIIRSHQKELEVAIRGITRRPLKTDILLLIKTEGGTPVAAFSVGHSEGLIKEIECGEFELKKTIKLPHLNKGNVSVDLYLHHPMIEWQMKAISCTVLECEGYQKSVGRASDICDCGWISLSEI